jgi:CHASE3 domain sensor protein
LVSRLYKFQPNLFQEFQNYLSNLSDDQQQALVKAIDNAKSEEESYRIIAAVIQNAQAKRVENLAAVIVQQEKINRNIRIEKIVIISLLGILAIGLIYSRKKY